MSEPSPEDELKEAFGRMVGFVVVSLGLLIGGAVLLFLVVAAAASFLYGD